MNAGSVKLYNLFMKGLQMMNGASMLILLLPEPLIETEFIQPTGIT